MFKKNKTDINFIASQKLGTKQNQSTSFEFILVATAIVLIILMGYLYFESWWDNKDTLEEIYKIYGNVDMDGDGAYTKEDSILANADKSAADALFLTQKNSEKYRAKLKYESKAKYGSYGASYNETGQLKLNGLKAERSQLQAEIQELIEANESAAAEVKLTSTHLIILDCEAKNYGISITSKSLSDNTLTINCTTDLYSNYYGFYSAMKSSSARNGLVNSKWFDVPDRTWSEAVTGDTFEETFSFTLKIVPLSDNPAKLLSEINTRMKTMSDNIKTIVAGGTNDKSLYTEIGIKNALVNNYPDLYSYADEVEERGKILCNDYYFKLDFGFDAEKDGYVVTISNDDVGNTSRTVLIHAAFSNSNAAEYAEVKIKEAELLINSITESISSNVTTRVGIIQELKGEGYVFLSTLSEKQNVLDTYGLSFDTADVAVIKCMYDSYVISYAADSSDVDGLVKIYSSVLLDSETNNGIPITKASDIASRQKYEAEELASFIEVAVSEKLTAEADIYDFLASNYGYEIANGGTKYVSVLHGDYSDYNLTFTPASKDQGVAPYGKSTIVISYSENSDLNITVNVRKALSLPEIYTIINEEAGTVNEDGGTGILYYVKTIAENNNIIDAADIFASIALNLYPMITDTDITSHGDENSVFYQGTYAIYKVTIVQGIADDFTITISSYLAKENILNATETNPGICISDKTYTHISEEVEANEN